MDDVVVTPSADRLLAEGRDLQRQGRVAEALGKYDELVALDPGSVDALRQRGTVLLKLKHWTEAIATYDQALALKPDAESYNNRGIALQGLGRHADALASHDAAVVLRPDHAGLQFNRGLALFALGNDEDAVAAYDRAISLQDGFAEAYNNRGNALSRLQRHEDAIASFDAALARRPEHAAAHWNRGLCHLMLGQYQAGWQAYEWRKRLDVPIGRRDFPQPSWAGQTPLEGKTLFVHSEQGFGDTLQFVRYLTLLSATTRIILGAQLPLLRLLRSLPRAITVIGENETPPPFDLHCALLSLPMALGTTIETIPAVTPYLRAEPADVSVWRDRVASLPRPRVGLCWAGDPRPHLPMAHAGDRHRSTSLAQLGPLSTVPGVSVISLQKGDASGQAATPPAGMVLHDWTRHINDFADTAALVEHLDLVITVDTAVAHLAGALGKPVWILERFAGCWRWLKDRSDSPWYPTARLFRQPAPGDWGSVVDAVAAALRQWTDARHG